MLTCPMCKKTVRSSLRECPTCRTDIGLLADYSDSIAEGLTRAEALTRDGELGEAVWAYLAVLESDPDNPVARRQVGQVAAAVRQFDRIAIGRRWMDKLQRQASFRRWAERWGQERRIALTAGLVLAMCLVLGAFAFGTWFGLQSALPQKGRAPAPELLDSPRESE